MPSKNPPMHTSVIHLLTNGETNLSVYVDHFPYRIIQLITQHIPQCAIQCYSVVCFNSRLTC